MDHVIHNMETGEMKWWTIDQMLEEINRDRSDQWEPYNKTDYLEGWNEWVEGELYELIK